MKTSYEILKKFQYKYPMTVAWRLEKHCKIIDEHLSSDENILFIFAGQKNESSAELFHTYVVAFTNKRIILATKRVLFGYFFQSITPDMYNDLTVHKGLIWGRVTLDTINEIVTITNIDGRALSEIENGITNAISIAKKELGIEKSTKR